jgi:hypothetical protein
MVTIFRKKRAKIPKIADQKLTKNLPAKNTYLMKKIKDLTCSFIESMNTYLPIKISIEDVFVKNKLNNISCTFLPRRIFFCVANVFILKHMFYSTDKYKVNLN